MKDNEESDKRFDQFIRDTLESNTNYVEDNNSLLEEDIEKILNELQKSTAV